MNRPTMENLLASGSYEDDLYANALGWKKPELFILNRAIVISVKLGTDVHPEGSANLPQFSINARIIGEDVSSDSPENEPPRWYPPFLPNVIVAVPEVGEQVFVVRETTLNNSKGFWMGRVNDTDVVSTKLTNEQNEKRNPDSITRYGMRFDVKKVNGQSRQPSSKSSKKVFQLPLSLGDVLIQGRSGSYIRNTFLPIYSNKPGLLEMGILESRPYQRNPTGTVGSTKTKTVHFSDARPTDVSPFLTKNTQETDESDIRRDFIVNIAEEIYNVSTTKDSESTMHKMVLGDRLNEYFKKQDIMMRGFVQTTQSILDVVQELFNSYIDHEHVIPEINISIPDKTIVDKQTINLGFRTERQPPRRAFVPARNVRVPGNGDVYETRTIRTPVGPKTERVLVARGTPGSTITIPSRFITVPMPDRTINLGYRTRTFKRRIKFNDINIGGSSNPRMTVPIETDSKTTDVQNNINSLKVNFDKIRNRFLSLTNSLSQHLSTRNFLN